MLDVNKLLCRKWIGGVVLVALGLAACSSKPKVDYKDLVDEDPQVRADAALRLGQARATDAVDSLIAMLDDPDEYVRITVVRALADIGGPEVVEPVMGMVDDPLRSVRHAACQAMGKLGDPRAIPALTKVLYDPDDRTRMIATHNLGLIDAPEVLDLMLDLSLRDESEQIRQHVIKVMVYRGAKEGVPRLESALQTEANIVRANAARALGKLGDRSSVPALIAALDDPFFKVRSLSAHSLFELAPDDPEVRAALKARLQTEQRQMTRVDLAWNLARMGDPEGLEVIRLFLFRGDPEDVRAEAAMALGEVGESSDIALLQKASKDKMGLVRQQVQIALQKLNRAQ